MNVISRAWWSIIGFGFHLLYNQLAFTYDTVSNLVSFGAWGCWQRAALAHLPPVDDGPVLELAYGTGRLQVALAEAGYRGAAGDLSPFMGRIASRRVSHLGLPQRLTRFRTQALPFPAAHFSAVVSTFPTNFIIDPKTLQEVRRVLKPGGVLVIVPSALLTGGGLAERILEGLYRITGQRAGEWDAGAHIFGGQGFNVIAHPSECPGSRVYTLVCRVGAAPRTDSGGV